MPEAGRDRRRPALLIAEALGHEGGWLLGGVLGGLVFIFAAPPLPAPVRRLSAEVPIYLGCCAVALAWLLLHTARRWPAQLRAMCRIFAVLVVVRMAAFHILLTVCYQQLPGRGGTYEVDTLRIGYQIRYMASLLAGSDVGELHQDPSRKQILQGYAEQQAITGETTLLGILPYYFPLALLIVGFGYATTVLLLPMTILGLAAVVQVWVFVGRQIRPQTGWVLLPYLILSTEFTIPSMTLQKDFITMIGLLQLLDIGLDPRVCGDRWWPLRYLGCGLWLLLVRPELVPLAGLLAVYFEVRRRLPEARRQQWLDRAMLLGITLLGRVVASRNAMYYGLPTDFGYWGGLVGSIFLPPLMWLLSPWILRDWNMWAWLTSSALRPVVGSLLVAAILLLRRGRIRVPTIVLVTCWVYLVAATSRSALHVVAVKHRLVIEPLLLALAIEAVWAIRAEPGRRRRQRYGALVVILTVASATVSILPKLLRGPREPNNPRIGQLLPDGPGPGDDRAPGPRWAAREGGAGLRNPVSPGPGTDAGSRVGEGDRLAPTRAHAVDCRQAWTSSARSGIVRYQSTNSGTPTWIGVVGA